ncbi:MAG: AAA family ATPase [Thermodesulfobacteriota bacterium]
MIKRIYIDNFRCMVNFELALGPMNLLLGNNGTGKSTVFDVLWRLRSFLAGDGGVASFFVTVPWEEEGTTRHDDTKESTRSSLLSVFAGCVRRVCGSLAPARGLFQGVRYFFSSLIFSVSAGTTSSSLATIP